MPFFFSLSLSSRQESPARTLVAWGESHPESDIQFVQNEGPDGTGRRRQHGAAQPELGRKQLSLALNAGDGGR
jgi:hypothetical protein